MLLGTLCLSIAVKVLTQLYIITAAEYEQAGYHEAFCLAAFSFVLSCLETLIRVIGETVQVEAVIPVGTAYEWQSMWAQVVDYVVKGDGEVLKEAFLTARYVIKGYGFIKDAEITCLTQIAADAEDEPHGVIIEAATDAVIAAFGERLVLMVTASVRELG